MIPGPYSSPKTQTERPESGSTQKEFRSLRNFFIGSGKSARGQRGFTLTELMTAMAITAIVTVHVLGMMSTQEKTYYAQKRTLELP